MRRIEAILRTEIGLELRFPIGISKPGNKSRVNYRQLSAPTVAQASLRHAATDVIRRLERFDHKQRIIGRLLQRLALRTCGLPRLQLFEGLVGPSCRHHDTHLPEFCNRVRRVNPNSHSGARNLIKGRPIKAFSCHAYLIPHVCPIASY